MSEQWSEDHTHEDVADRALIERIDAAYEPARLSPSARYALERDLWARIERRRRPALLRPVLAMVTVVAAVLWFARRWTSGRIREHRGLARGQR